MRRSDAGHDQQHDQRKMIEIEGEICVEVAGANPGGDRFRVGRGQGREMSRDLQRLGKCRATKRQRNPRNSLPGKALAEQAIDGGADQRQHRNQPEMQI